MLKISARNTILYELLRLHFKRKYKNKEKKILDAVNFYGKTLERKCSYFG